MVLFINGEEVDGETMYLLGFLDSFGLENSAKEFNSQPLLEISDDSYTLYVHQHESAIVKDGSPLKLIGSDDATTCHYMLIIGPNKLIAFCHLDESESLLKIINSILEIINLNESDLDKIDLSVYLVGGFDDPRHYSENLSLEILSILHSHVIHFHLKLAAITFHNNVKKGNTNFPIVYGVAYDLEKEILVPARFPPQLRGPLNHLRSTRCFARIDIENIYDTEAQEIVIKPFDYKSINNLEHIDSMTKQPDHVLRKYSTSPAQEPEWFASNMRANFILMRDHPYPLKSFFKNGSLRYKLNDHGIWEEKSV